MNLNILLEEILGNTAIVYHRGNKNKLNYLLNGSYTNAMHIDFIEYNKGLYTTFDLNSQLNTNKNQKNDMKKTYGDCIIKLAVKGISNFWFCDYDLYKRYNPSATPESWKEQQFNKFNINKDLRDKFGGNQLKFDHVTVSKLFEQYGALGKRVKGIVYNGKHDGNCVLLYDWKTAVPISISENEGKTWKKIDRNETKDSRANFSKNDYIDTDKKMIDKNIRVAQQTTSLQRIKLPQEVEGNFICDHCSYITSLQGAPQKVGGAFDCSFCYHLASLQGAPQSIGKDFKCNGNNLTSLQGAPQEVGRDFNCSENSLTSLQGAPQEVGRDFWCYYNKLTSLQGAPQEVGRDFDCHANNLTSLQGTPKSVGGKFVCSYNRLTSLERAPQSVGGKFDCSYNNLASLQGAPKYVAYDFDCRHNKLTSLQGAPQEVGGIFNCRGNKISREEAVRYMKSSNCKKIVGVFGTITRKDIE